MRTWILCGCSLTLLAAGEAAAPSPGGLRAGVRSVRDTVPPVAAQARFSAGWDSNALLDHDPDRAHAETAVYGSEASVSWRPVRDGGDLLQLQALAGYDRRPHLEDFDTTRLSLGAVGASQRGELTLGASLMATRLWQAEEGAAAELRGGLSAMRLDPADIDILALELAYLHIDAVGDRPEQLSAVSALGDPDPRSGLLTAIAWRHWWRWETQRIEGALRLGRYNARAEDESYATAQPWAQWRWRPEGWDASVRTAFDARQYASEASPATDAEQSLTWSTTVSFDRYLAAGLWLGATAGWSQRWSDAAGREYERWQAGLRLTWNHPSVQE